MSQRAHEPPGAAGGVERRWLITHVLWQSPPPT